MFRRAGNRPLDTSRRNWLLGRRCTETEPVKLPWLRDQDAFSGQCTRCAACVESCPQGILVIRADGLPSVEFSAGECTFCGQCGTACPEHLFFEDTTGRPWDLVATIDSSCLANTGITCRCCEDVCELNAIRFQPRLGQAPFPELSVDACSGCGACVSSCPVAAIKIDFGFSTEKRIGQTREPVTSSADIP